MHAARVFQYPAHYTYTYQFGSQWYYLRPSSVGLYKLNRRLPGFSLTVLRIRGKQCRKRMEGIVRRAFSHVVVQHVLSFSTRQQRQLSVQLSASTSCAHLHISVPAHHTQTIYFRQNAQHRWIEVYSVTLGGLQQSHTRGSCWGSSILARYCRTHAAGVSCQRCIQCHLYNSARSTCRCIDHALSSIAGS